MSNPDLRELDHPAYAGIVMIYRFSIHNADGSDREATGRMALADDNAARAFGKAMIRDMMLGNTPRYTGWTMDVAKGARPVCSIPFPRNESLPTYLDDIGKGAWPRSDVPDPSNRIELAPDVVPRSLKLAPRTRG